jgi:hypothetical protein
MGDQRLADIVQQRGLGEPLPVAPGVMRTHAALGADLLAQEGAFEPEILDVVRYHHERLDGPGPAGRRRARHGCASPSSRRA